MQLRISPGGNICNSSRKRPELPPSSETVTIADRLSIQIRSSVLLTRVFRPASGVESPVPPPIATRFWPPVVDVFCNERSGRFSRVKRQRKSYRNQWKLSYEGLLKISRSKSGSLRR